ncbi:MAG TPA: uracil-DNA glycosylase family protein [Gallionellaceae bacterium]|nr:uracil-DNA glycosylase family protein [Gallionellaceae bacterium]
MKRVSWPWNVKSKDNALNILLREVRACEVCAEHLPFPPKPILRAGRTARLMIVGQAPGRRVHETGIPWNDPSGDRLRNWMHVTRDIFYDESRIAIIPTAFCYPGTGTGGDLPPRPECAPLWHPRLRAALPDIRLTLLVGSYAQSYYLGGSRHKTLTETVRHYRDYQPEFFPLPHPSPRNQMWLKRNQWFTEEVLPVLREEIASFL